MIFLIPQHLCKHEILKVISNSLGTKIDALMGQIKMKRSDSINCRLKEKYNLHLRQ